jgi:YggT family protein
VLHRVTDPIIEPFKKVMPNTGMMDLSPMMAIIVIIVMRQLVIGVAQPF